MKRNIEMHNEGFGYQRRSQMYYKYYVYYKLGKVTAFQAGPGTDGKLKCPDISSWKSKSYQRYHRVFTYL